MTSPRHTARAARLAGALYLLTFASSIPALLLLGPVLDDPRYVLGPGADTRVLLGTLLDVVNAVACIATAVVLLPLLRHRGEARAVGFLAARLTEAAIILVGVVALLAVVTLRQQVGAGDLPADPATATVAGALVAVRDWTFLLGPGLVSAVNAALLGSLLLRSGLVPRLIPVLALVGAPLQVVSVVLTVLGLNHQLSTLSAVAVAPIFLWELSLGLRLVTRGFDAPRHPGGGRAEAPAAQPAVT
ncbi:DUF4386 domain-containing protein [Cellulomonas sp. S1-8]|uniref:DUF4386 domain-containing protein n=1 Tax=Cellulomonas sp. S1-8 TaxID=2904790 RepID=UPI002242F96B|nr:DUF4386 domain-containing protein [Cellulomonas sp. S1-8]UZN04053.1 DUF4386 domain-containing protein [Cellulomonas sp. S1-8]